MTATDAAYYIHGLKLIDSTYGTYLYDAHGSVIATYGEINDEPQYGITQTYDYDAFDIALHTIRDVNMAEEMGGESPIRAQSSRSADNETGDVDDNPFRYCGEYLDFNRYLERLVGIMRISDLKFILDRCEVPNEMYSLTDGLPSEKYCIAQISNDLWETYYSERGSKSCSNKWQYEGEACIELLTALLNDSYYKSKRHKMH